MRKCRVCHTKVRGGEACKWILDQPDDESEQGIFVLVPSRDRILDIWPALET